jgi:hypothetical protein
MRIHNDSDQSVNFRDGGGGPRAPWFWFDNLTLDGAATPWADCAPGSIYILTTGSAATVYVKKVNNQATADWVALISGTSAGDVTVTGTLTAGDVVIAP